MKRYILIRVLQSLVAMMVISVIAFSLAHLSGSPVDSMLPDDAGADEAQVLIELWGLDKPLYQQYFVFLGNVLQGDFGNSIKWPGRTALELVLSRLPATIQLGGFAILISTLIAIPIGVLAAVHKDTPLDTIGKLIALLGQAMPNFWIAIVLIWVFAVKLGWFPTSGRGTFGHLVLPAIALGWYQVAALMRLTRSAMLEVLDTEYIKLARIKGVPEWRVIWVHALRNAAVVPLTYFGVIFGAIFTGSVVIETVFAWPGTGSLAIEAIRGHDFPVIQTVVMLFAGVFIFANLLVDLAYAYLDPRIRYT